MPKSFWLDRRTDPGKPATHVLIVGVSRYHQLDQVSENLFLNLEQLDCAATAGWQLACWLRDNYESAAPLETIQLLVSPSSSEAERIPELRELQIATTENVTSALHEWKRLCLGSPNAVAVFYAAGHGIAGSNEQSHVLLADFGSRPAVLENAIDVGVVRSGMLDHGIAQTQLYFVDACRIPHIAFERFHNLGHGIALPGMANMVDSRCSPVYFSAAPGTRAYGQVGTGTIFSRALIDCLACHAIREPQCEGGPWHVSTSSLEEALERRVRDLAAEIGEDQMVVVGGQRRNAVLNALSVAPKVPISVRLIPADAKDYARADLSDCDGVCVWKRKAFDPNPLYWSGSAGIYMMEISISAEGARLYRSNQKKLFVARPPSTNTEVSVA